MSQYNFKVIFVGAKNVGKTTFVKRNITGHFTKEYISTYSVEISNYKCKTTYGDITFNIWEVPNCEEFEYMENYCADGDAFLIFYSLIDQLSIEWAFYFEELIKLVCPGIPYIYCGNKSDHPDKDIIEKVSPAEIQEYHVSAKSNHQINLPFLLLARELTDHSDLLFVENDPILPPTVEL